MWLFWSYPWALWDKTTTTTKKPFLILKKFNKESGERETGMENKAQEETSTINVSALTCIDLASSDLHRSAVLLKQARVHLYFLSMISVWPLYNCCYVWFLFQACLESGFFYVINHGLSEELKDETFEQSKKFFALPLEEKMKVLRNKKNRGYSPVLDQILDPENQVHG